MIACDANDSFIDIHTHLQIPGIQSIVCYSLGRDRIPDFSEELHSAGVHPWDSGTTDLRAALDFLETAPIVALGEIGLDYAIETDKEVQLKVFEAQLAIAQRRALPVVIHCVKAYNDVMKILVGYRLRAVIFHGYTGSTVQAESFLNAGYYLSFGERSLGSGKTVESLRQTPLQRIFAETDTSEMPIQTIYGRIAEIKGIGVPALQESICANFKRVFDGQ